jgi:hypothetical protein
VRVQKGADFQGLFEQPLVNAFYSDKKVCHTFLSIFIAFIACSKMALNQTLPLPLSIFFSLF